MVRRRIRLAQNFFRDPGLVASLVAGSSLGKNDVVYEIGPGEGIITRELAGRAGRVVAIEKDAALAARLRERFRSARNVRVCAGDFLRHGIREPEYRVFSNIPFNITAEVVKGILFGANPPREAHLVLQKEAAGKFSGCPNETEVSVLAKPGFAISVLRAFQRTDFEPAPGVDVVLLHIVRRQQPLVSPDDARSYQEFVRFGFQARKRNLKTTYQRVFTYEQWKRLSQNLRFPIRATPSQLTFEQWLGLFEYFQAHVIDSKRARVSRGREEG